MNCKRDKFFIKKTGWVPHGVSLKDLEKHACYELSPIYSDYYSAKWFCRKFKNHGQFHCSVNMTKDTPWLMAVWNDEKFVWMSPKLWEEGYTEINLDLKPGFQKEYKS